MRPLAVPTASSSALTDDPDATADAGREPPYPTATHSTRPPPSGSQTPAPPNSESDLDASVPPPLGTSDWLDGGAPFPFDAALGDAGVCPFGPVALVNVFSFRLRADGRCLAVGASTVSDGVGALQTRLTEDCTAADAQWQLIPQAFGGSEVRNFFWGLSLELQNDSLAPGTDAVLILPGFEPVQAFSVWQLPSGHFTLAPWQLLSSCLGSSYTGKAELSDCVSGNQAQQWWLTPYDCSPKDAGALLEAGAEDASLLLEAGVIEAGAALEAGASLGSE